MAPFFFLFFYACIIKSFDENVKKIKSDVSAIKYAFLQFIFINLSLRSDKESL